MRQVALILIWIFVDKINFQSKFSNMFVTYINFDLTTNELILRSCRWFVRHMSFRFREYVFAQSFHRSIEKLLHYSILWFFIHWWSRLISFFEHFDISKTNRVDNLISVSLFKSHRCKLEISTNLFEKIVAIDLEFDDYFRFFF